MKHAMYSEYKTSNIGWIRDFPVHWELKRLKYVASRAEVKVEADEDNPLPYIGLEQVEPWTGRLIELDDDLVPTGVSNRFAAGDTLFGKLRPYLAKACNVDFDGLCSSELLVLRGKTYDRKFLLYQLLSHGFINLVDSSTYGSKMPRASWDFIGICELPLPPLDEQQTTARFLDAKTAQIDALMAQKRQLIAKLKEKRQALITRTVTRGLPPEAAKAAGLEPNPAMKPLLSGWADECPEHWQVWKISHGFGLTGSGTTPPSDNEEWYDGDIPWVTTGELRECIVTDTSKKVSRAASKEFSALKIFPAGSLAIAMYGATIGRLGIFGVAATTNQACCVLAKERAFERDFIFYWLQAFRDQIVMLATGGGQPNISQEKIRSLKIPCPSVHEQRTISKYLREESEKIDRLVDAAESAVERINEFRQAVITSAVTGKIDVRELAQ